MLWDPAERVTVLVGAGVSAWTPPRPVTKLPSTKKNASSSAPRLNVTCDAVARENDPVNSAVRNPLVSLPTLPLGPVGGYIVVLENGLKTVPDPDEVTTSPLYVPGVHHRI